MTFKNCWNPHNQELTMDELIEMLEEEQGIEELKSSNLVQSEDWMMVGNLTEDFNLIEKGLKIVENTYS
ncbi:hypothetical protein TNCV_3598861 [Trichonephila clavipes]|nr:hypothetical protein TNCV_3598861 [Trichonephila clavipes]